MRIDFKNIPVKFNPDPIWNDRTLGCLEDCHPQKEEEQQDE